MVFIEWECDEEMEKEISSIEKDILLVSYKTGIDPEIIWNKMTRAEFKKLFQEVKEDVKKIKDIRNKNIKKDLNKGGYEVE